MLTDLATAVRKSGLRVIELDGWKTRGRPASTGGFSPRGVLCHHTGATTDSLTYVNWMTLTGRSDLPAPLCQIAFGHDSTVYVCAAGRANHGGTARATGPMPAGDANSLYVGIEAMNSGSEGWGSRGTDANGQSLTQGEGYARLCAALCAHYVWDAATVRAHKETSVTGKWDPGLLDMDHHRAAVARLITAPEGLIMDKEVTAAFASVTADIAGLSAQVKRFTDTNADRSRADYARIKSLIKDGRKTNKTAEQILAALEADAPGKG